MKLPNGYGAIMKLSGRRRKPYAVRITVGWTEDGKQIRKYLGYYKTRQEAIKALADYNENPFDLATREITFAELYEKWLTLKERGKQVTACNAAAFKSLSVLHNMAFVDIRKRHIQGIIDSSDLSFSSKQRMKVLCNQLFKYAIDQEIVTTNFAALVEMPPSEQSQIHIPFNSTELDTLWQNTDDSGVVIALILSYTGLRPAELAQIKTSDVDLENRYMRGGIKTAAGKNRIIPIAKKILPIINQLYNPSAEYLLASPLDNKPALTYARLVNHFWKRSSVLKSLPTKHLPHDGRHTCATLLANAEVPLETRQLILGHAARDITSRVYTHKTIQQLVDAIDRKTAKTKIEGMILCST